MTTTEPGKLIVISGPSGAGKSTVLRRLLARRVDRLVLSVSATTRAPRPGEQDGVDYFFLSTEEFQRRREAGEFLESCQVFGTAVWYGTLLGEVTPSLRAGKWVILEIDVQGTREVLRRFPDAVTIFVRPASEAELERRLKARGTESADAIQRRLEVAQRELAEAGIYRYQVINENVEQAVSEIDEILTRGDLS